ncbi:nuclear transport factor 2 family protein [uncultured Sphingomonas sp.]|uniref:nuclear transport factor 2 family protein n=1 Tax=uncultured Sphingomonas sp. TaxID=158754 RepID=UPI0035CC1338
MLMRIACGLVAAGLYATPTSAEWKPAGAEVRKASKDPQVAAVLATIDRLDAALVADDRAVFSSLMADELVVNNPGNVISDHGATVRLNSIGRISYSKYDRVIEYAGIRGDMVLLMGEELVVPKSPNPLAGQQVRRRFTDLWRNANGRWLLTARQATIIEPRR